MASSPWQRQSFAFTRREDALSVLQDEDLLQNYWDRLLEVLTLVEANSSTNTHETDLAWDMIDAERVKVLVYGESGAGKSLLVRTLTGCANARSSHTSVGTLEATVFPTPCGVDFIDTPGVKIPLELSEADSYFSWARDAVAWRALLGDLQSRLSSRDAALRPLAVVYVHRASARVIPERIKELLSKGFHMLVPTFLLVTDVCGVDDDALQEVRQQMSAIVADLGENKLGAKVSVIEVGGWVCVHGRRDRG